VLAGIFSGAVMTDASGAMPFACPRCELSSSRRSGEVWCCRDLAWLKAAMSGESPPTMEELLRARFIGRTAKSIDNVCRRYGFKTPLRIKRRRPRCEICASLFDGPGKLCGACGEGLDAERERRAA